MYSSDSSSSSSSESDSEPDEPRGKIFADGYDEEPIPPDNDTGPSNHSRSSNVRAGWREPPASTSRAARTPARIPPPLSVVDARTLDRDVRQMIEFPGLDASLQWHCPMCNECFDVMNVTGNQRQALTADACYESNGRYIVRNERRNTSLRRIWRRHGDRHLKERGVYLDAVSLVILVMRHDT